MAIDIRQARTDSGDADRSAQSDRVAQAGPAARVGRLRLTRRGRALVRGLSWLGTTAAVATVVVALVLALAAYFAPGAQAGDGRPVTGQSSTAVVVGPGDSLWSLAEQLRPDRDPRDVVSDIEQANGLRRGAVLPVGVVLQVPSS